MIPKCHLCLQQVTQKCETVTELTKALTVLDAVHWISTSWKATKPSTVTKCFGDSGIIGVSSAEKEGESVDIDVDEDNDDVPLVELLCRKKFDMPVCEVLK